MCVGEMEEKEGASERRGGEATGSPVTCEAETPAAAGDLELAIFGPVVARHWPSAAPKRMARNVDLVPITGSGVESFEVEALSRANSNAIRWRHWVALASPPSLIHAQPVPRTVSRPRSRRANSYAADMIDSTNKDSKDEHRSKGHEENESGRGSTRREVSKIGWK